MDEKKNFFSFNFVSIFGYRMWKSKKYCRENTVWVNIKHTSLKTMTSFWRGVGW